MCCKTSTFFFYLTAFVGRLITLYIGILIDNSGGPITFTDTDYDVFSDAATHVWNGGSPFSRHTYRYTPLAAYACLVNNWIHPQAGKVLFCILDIITGIIFWQLIELQKNALPAEEKSKKLSTMIYVFFWLYNPMVAGMACRGSNDIIITLLVLLSLYLVLKQQYVIGGIFYGLSVHFKIYPIIYCFVLYFFIDMDRSMIAQGRTFAAITS